MPSSLNPDWITWISSAAREILLEDLEPGGKLHQEDHVPVEIVWDLYKLYPEFKDVVYSQFKVRLEDHRKQAMKRCIASREEERMMEHDRQLHPEELYNHRGEAVFSRFPAAELLAEDVEAKLHEGVTARELQETRIEYKIVSVAVFEKKIRQAVRLQKFINYLEWKRTKKRVEFYEIQKKKVEKEKKVKAKKEAKEVKEAEASTKNEAKEAKAKAKKEGTEARTQARKRAKDAGTKARKRAKA